MSQSQFDLMSHKPYAEAWKNLQALQARRDEISDTLSRCQIKTDAGRSAPTVNSLVTGMDLLNPATDYRKDDEEDSDFVAISAADHDKLIVERRQLHKAIDLQKQVLDKLREQASSIVVEQARPGYTAAVRDITAALKVLAEAATREKQIRESLNDSGVLWIGSLPVMNIPSGLFELNDLDSLVNRYERDAKQYGYLKAKPEPKGELTNAR